MDGNDSVGGLVGCNLDGFITNCYAVGAVTGHWFVGGVVGKNQDSSIANCYSTTSVIGSSWVGGLIGIAIDWAEFVSNFWDVNTSGSTDGVGNISLDPNGVTGKTTTEMKKLSTFTSAGWDFVDIWNIGENQTYPFLRKYPTGDLNLDKRVDFIDFAIFADDWLEKI